MSSRLDDSGKDTNFELIHFTLGKKLLLNEHEGTKDVIFIVQLF